MAGFVMIPREIIDDDIWSERREMSRFEAVVDLLCRLAWEEKTTTIGGAFNKIGKGEVAVSRRTLAARWGWSEKKVRVFLKSLVKKGWFEARIGNKVMVLKWGPVQGTVRGPVNPDENQAVNPDEVPVRGPVQGTNTNNKKKTIKRKNNKKENSQQGTLNFEVDERPSVSARAEGINPSLEDCRKEFNARGIYDDGVVQAFFDYYSQYGWVGTYGRKIVRLDSLVNRWIKENERRNGNNVGRSGSERALAECAAVAAAFRKEREMGN